MYMYILMYIYIYKYLYTSSTTAAAAAARAVSAHKSSTDIADAEEVAAKPAGVLGGGRGVGGRKMRDRPPRQAQEAAHDKKEGATAGMGTSAYAKTRGNRGTTHFNSSRKRSSRFYCFLVIFLFVVVSQF